MNTKHTPGPWSIKDDDGIIANNQYWIASIHIARTKDEKEANARLIASAPELLEALIKAENTLLDMDSNYGGAGIALPMAQAAIAKATGQ